MDNTTWESEEERKLRNEIKRWWRAYIPPEPRVWDNVKMAYVFINGKRQMLGVDNVTMKGYKMEENVPTFKRPLEEQGYNSFERWCTLWDM